MRPHRQVRISVDAEITYGRNLSNGASISQQLWSGQAMLSSVMSGQNPAMPTKLNRILLVLILCSLLLLHLSVSMSVHMSGWVVVVQYWFGVFCCYSFANSPILIIYNSLTVSLCAYNLLNYLIHYTQILSSLFPCGLTLLTVVQTVFEQLYFRVIHVYFRGLRSIKYKAVSLWNDLPQSIKDIQSIIIIIIIILFVQ